MQHPRPRPGARGVVTGSSLGSDAPLSTPSPCKIQARPVGDRGRRGFARDIVFAEFGYQHGRAIDYDDFIDRAPDQLPRFWRAAT